MKGVVPVDGAALFLHRLPFQQVAAVELMEAFLASLNSFLL